MTLNNVHLFLADHSRVQAPRTYQWKKWGGYEGVLGAGWGGGRIGWGGGGIWGEGVRDDTISVLGNLHLYGNACGPFLRRDPSDMQGHLIVAIDTG